MVTTTMDTAAGSDQKWPPSPGPEVIEADLGDTSTSVKAREFSGWTSNGLPGKQDGTNYIVPNPVLSQIPSPPPLPSLKPPVASRNPTPRPKPQVPVRKPAVPVKKAVPQKQQPIAAVSDPGTPSVPVPKPRTRTSKDPYAKRKAKFEQKPKLAPITEADSRRSSQVSNLSSNHSSDWGSREVLTNGNTAAKSETANMVEEDSNLNTEESTGVDPLMEEELEDVEESTEGVEMDEQEPSYMNSGDLGALIERGPIQIDSPLPLPEPIVPEPPKEKCDQPQPELPVDPELQDDPTIYENVVLKPDGSVESVSFLNPVMPPPLRQRDDTDTAIRPPRPKSDFNVQTDFPEEMYENLLNHARNLDKKNPSEVTDGDTKDTGVGPDDMNGHVNLGFDADDDLALEIEAATDMLHEVCFGRGRGTQTGDSLRLASAQSDFIAKQLNRCLNRPVSDCVMTESGTSMDDLDRKPAGGVVMRNPKPTQTEPAAVMRDPKPTRTEPEVVMRNPKPTQTEPAVVMRNPKPTQTESAVVMRNPKPNHIEPSIRNQPDVVMQHQPTATNEQHQNGSIDRINYVNEGVHGIRESLQTIEPPSYERTTHPSITEHSYEDIPKRRNGKMCVGMSVIFIVIILGIIAAGVIVYFVVRQMESTDESNLSMKAYYLGITLKNQNYTPELEDDTSDIYKRVSQDICTFIGDAMHESHVFTNIYKDCEIMDFKQGSIAAHVKMVFLKERLQEMEDNDGTPATGRIVFYLKNYLEESPDAKAFNQAYGPDVSNFLVAQFWSGLSEYGTLPSS